MSASRARLVAVPCLAVGLSLAVGLAGCTSSGSSGAPSSAPGTSGPAGTSSTAGRAVDPATLAHTLSTALTRARSAHVATSLALAGSTLTGAGDVTLARGGIAQADITQQLPGGLGQVRLIFSGRRSYAKLPSVLSRSGKPWTLLSTSSGNPVVAQLAGTVSGLLTVASPSTFVRVARAASSARDLGAATVDGVATTHYLVVADTSKLPSTTLGGGFSTGGAKTLPVDLWTDSAGRPVQVRGTLRLQGTAVTPTVTLSDYNAPVTITAPPASQVDG